jgi:hypothetical protein
MDEHGNSVLTLKRHCEVSDGEALVFNAAGLVVLSLHVIYYKL